MAGLPKVILVMRHAEKPADPNKIELSLDGFARAEKLAHYIPEQLASCIDPPLPEALPDVIFAAADSAHSVRPRQTVEALGRRALKKRPGAIFDASIEDNRYEQLVKELSGDRCADRTVVVCWHHGHIPALMNALGAKEGDYPDPWDEHVFNLILQVEYADGACQVTRVVEPF
jgi:hypothetical protein